MPVRLKGVAPDADNKSDAIAIAMVTAIAIADTTAIAISPAAGVASSRRTAP